MSLGIVALGVATAFLSRRAAYAIFCAVITERASSGVLRRSATFLRFQIVALEVPAALLARRTAAASAHTIVLIVTDRS